MIEVMTNGPETIPYFAYGSNMNLAQMARRCRGGYHQLLGIGRLDDHGIIINNRGFANIYSEKGSQVWGLMFEIDGRALAKLNYYEGFPRLYRHAIVTVRFAQRDLRSLTYMDRNNKRIGPPQPGYLEDMVESYKRFAFPDENIAHLESFFPTPDLGHLVSQGSQ